MLIPKSFAEGHQPKVQDEPDWKREKRDGDEPVPSPRQVMRLYGEDHNHQIIGEARVAEEGTILEILSAQAAEEGESAKDEHEEGDKEIYRQHGVEGEVRASRAVRYEVGPKPLRSGPKKAEASLNGGTKVRLGGSQFVEEEREVERDDAPD